MQAWRCWRRWRWRLAVPRRRLAHHRQAADQKRRRQAKNGYVAAAALHRRRRPPRRRPETEDVDGRADANSQVRLSSPDGAVYAAVTDSRGAFSLALPVAKTVRLFGLSEDKDGRRVQGEGYLAVMPSPGRPAVLLRAGVGAQAPGPPPALARVTAVDFDTGAGPLVSGAGAARRDSAPVVDGVAERDEARADGQGRFSFVLAAALKPGDHDLLVQFSGGEDPRTVESSARPSPFRGFHFPRWAADGRLAD